MNTGNDVIISAALTGAVTPKDINENIPLTPEEIAADAYRCWQQGAAIVHLHMRDDEGMGTMDREKFAQTIRLLRDYRDCDVIINCTTSGDHRASDAQRMAHVSTLDGIEMASWDAGSFNWMPGGVFINSPQFLGKLGEILTERSIKPEVEIFDSGMLGVASYFVEQGKLLSPLHYQFCLGVPGGMPATVENLNYLVSHIPADATWSAFGVGKHHLPILFATLALGGHVRVGLEDNVYFSKGVKATNPQLVERAAQAIRLAGKQVATPASARKILGIRPL
ncbi:3-keto-5-aminohexanoate cleavage protein [Brenneria roseae subsp. americana]|uniref:3-keto-5-aminohexanoate cleavage protein n=1 Tax=Brenneria roseae subsp. americana TaxID=1508507 RepID=A0A2U1TZM8_9GAMM|nr:3-keto-5-aminohexanoate cleavage protein [Brenneria roseae]PWC14850.1 3-keto-5-aminohexanoate cleavage protein [Brenneria roseae subsp. americana]